MGECELEATHVYVRWTGSKVANEPMFSAYLKSQMPVGTTGYGGKELDAGGIPQYHVLMSFPQKVYWTDVRSKLTLRLEDGTLDTEDIRIETPRQFESIPDFQIRMQPYFSNIGNPFTFDHNSEASSTRTQRRLFFR